MSTDTRQHVRKQVLVFWIFSVNLNEECCAETALNLNSTFYVSDSEHDFWGKFKCHILAYLLQMLKANSKKLAILWLRLSHTRDNHSQKRN